MKYILLAISFLVVSCGKVKVENLKVIESIQLLPSTVEGDGSSQVDLIIKINKSADLSRRKLAVETSSGSFGTSGLKSTTLEAVYENTELIARAKIKAPSAPGFIVITARPEFRNAYHDFIVKDSIPVSPSMPVSITASASAFGVQTGFVGEVLITGTLKNAKGKNVSTGVKVQFADFYQNGMPVGGRFRQTQNSSDESSKVTAYYSPGLIPPGTGIIIRITILDAQGNPTGIFDSVIVTVTP